MAVKTKTYNRNRFRKTYPRFRASPSNGVISDGAFTAEGLIINFSDESSKVITLTGRYQSVPSVSITPVGDINNVNLYISSVSLASVPSAGGKTAVVTIEASAPFTGQVHVQVVEA